MTQSRWMWDYSSKWEVFSHVARVLMAPDATGARSAVVFGDWLGVSHPKACLSAGIQVVTPPSEDGYAFLEYMLDQVPSGARTLVLSEYSLVEGEEAVHHEELDSCLLYFLQSRSEPQEGLFRAREGMKSMLFYSTPVGSSCCESVDYLYDGTHEVRVDLLAPVLAGMVAADVEDLLAKGVGLQLVQLRTEVMWQTHVYGPAPAYTGARLLKFWVTVCIPEDYPRYTTERGFREGLLRRFDDTVEDAVAQFCKPDIQWHIHRDVILGLSRGEEGETLALCYTVSFYTPAKSSDEVEITSQGVFSNKAVHDYYSGDDYYDGDDEDDEDGLHYPAGSKKSDDDDDEEDDEDDDDYDYDDGEYEN